MAGNNKKLAFTLAEVMIVLLVLTILFAAFAPLITKRRTKANKVDIWRWSSRNYYQGPMNAYYNTDNNKSEVFFGVSPNNLDEVNNIYSPKAKVVIRSGSVTSGDYLQRQMQFRYGGSNTNLNGTFAGTLFADTKNILLGGTYRYLFKINDNIFNNEYYPSNNTAVGYQALNFDYTVVNASNVPQDGVNAGDIKYSKNNSAMGYNSLANLSTGYNNTAIGSHSGESVTTGYSNAFVGSYAGYSSTGSNNTFIGYRANAGTGSYNNFIGAYAGNSNNDQNWGTGASGGYNTAIGYNTLGNLTSGNYNTAIGSGALKKLTSGSYNTAIGYNACENITSESYKTCIGAKSGPSENSSATRDLSIDNEDGNNYNYPGVQRTYIGSAPKGTTFGGDAVLEIHNSASKNNQLANNPGIKSNTTTIINGNLLVRGNTYFTVGSRLYPFYRNETTNQIGSTIGQYCNTDQQTYIYSTSQTKCSSLSNAFGTYSSDRRIKNIGYKNNDGLDKITQLNIYNYTFKDDAKKKPHVGVIAQELQKIFPNSVAQDKNGYLKIRWDEMFYAAINALKELNAKITKLIKEATDLETQISKMEKENAELNAQVEALTLRVNQLKKSKH